MYTRHKISNMMKRVPYSQGIYAMFESKLDKNAVYIGISTNLRNRIRQHMIRRDSSVTTKTSAVRLNPDYIEVIKWWVNDKFEDKVVLEAAELVAFDVFNPVLRSKGSVSLEAKKLYKKEKFKSEIKSILLDKQSGYLHFPDLNNVLSKIDKLKMRVDNLEERIEKSRNK